MTTQQSLQTGPLVEIDADMRNVTPPSLLTDPPLATSQAVWADNDTIWVSTTSAPYLLCLRPTQTSGPITQLPVASPPSALAEANGAVYVTGTQAGTILSYRVPAACQ